MNPSKPPADASAIHVAIQTRGGRLYRYRARDLRLCLRRGSVHVIEKDAGCFVYFDHCDLAVTDPDGRTLFQLNRGQVDEIGSNLEVVTAGPAGT
jgi:hypothetical protein